VTVPRSPARLLAALVAAAALVLAGCAGDDPVLEAAPTTTTVATTTAAPATTTRSAPATASTTLVAEAVGEAVAVYDAPDALEPTRVLDRSDEVSGTLVFVVEQATPDRLLVQLPVRPNGSTGWVDRSAVALTRHAYRVEVELGAHRLRVWDGAEVVMDSVIAVGTEDTPTPGGTFYITELLQPPDPTGPYGTYAYGLSGFSTVLESFNGGDGVIGIHGTNEPERLGTDVSHGCIRLSNDDIETLVEDVGLPLGTPVAILP
jgi:lipoprotein-anchoring transpeptidase ErfK/SrfK